MSVGWAHVLKYQPSAEAAALHWLAAVRSRQKPKTAKRPATKHRHPPKRPQAPRRRPNQNAHPARRKSRSWHHKNGITAARRPDRELAEGCNVSVMPVTCANVDRLRAQASKRRLPVAVVANSAVAT